MIENNGGNDETQFEHLMGFFQLISEINLKIST